MRQTIRAYASVGGIRRSALAALAALASLAIAGCPKPSPRPPGTDGTARWAFGIAQPKIAAFAPDAELRTIAGAPVSLDGRLPANTGSWSFVAWSPTRSTIQVIVNADGTTSSSQRTDLAPGPGIQQPLPAGWADSGQVFAATSGKRDPAARLANLVVLNVASYTQAPGKAVWAISFDAGPNQLVAVDGAYLPPE
jgi:hypothetical protein